MSLYGVIPGDKTALRKLYNDKESSDVVLIPRDVKPIYAHEKVLAAGCESLYGGHTVCVHGYRSEKYQKLLNLDDVIAFGGPELSQESFESAIKHMYGFDFKGVGKPPHSLLDLAEVALIAEELEVTGLFEVVSKITNRAMIESFGDEAKMKQFLCIGRFYGRGVQNGLRVFQPFATKIIAENFFDLHKTEALHDLFYWVPSLAREVLRFMGDHLGPKDEEDDVEPEEEDESE